MTLAAPDPTRRAPGIVFETVPEPLDQSLPRMDIAAFVGFASSGPLDTPVVVEDVARFREVFGGDQPLGFDDETGLVATANLGPAVEAFFANGGRRGWIVRVAGPATVNRMGLPGLIEGDADDSTTWTLASARSRSAGSWSDLHRAGAVRESRVLDVDGSSTEIEDGGSRITVPGVVTVEPGDLIEVGFSEGLRLVAEVASVEPDTDHQQVVTSGARRWLQRAALAATVPESAVRLTIDGRSPLTVLEVGVEPDGLAEMIVDVSTPVEVGDTLLVSVDDTELVTVVHHVASDGERLLADGFPTWQLAVEPTTTGAITGVNRVRIGLGHWVEDRLVGAVGDLACSPLATSRWLGHLPTDDELFGRQARLARQAINRAARHRLGPLDERVTAPRLGLAADTGGAIVLPLCLLDGHELTRAGRPLPTADRALVRDGLGQLDSDLFLDPGLRHYGLEALPAELNRRLADPATTPSGLHALAPFSEISMLSVPDAVTGSWRLRTTEPVAPVGTPVVTISPPSRCSWGAVPGATTYEIETSADHTFASPSARFESTELSHDLAPAACGRPFIRVRAAVGDRAGSWSNTVDLRFPATAIEPCDDPIPTPPSLVPTANGVRWSARAGVPYVLEQASNPDFVDGRRSRFEAIVDGPIESEPVEGVAAADGASWFRVRGETEPPSPWSNAVARPAEATTRWMMDAAPDARTVAPEVQRAMMTLAAARADMIAVLSLPRDIDLVGASTHLAGLVERGERGDRARSHAAVYHPWMSVGVATDRGVVLTARPPEGAVVGLLARYAIERGAWIAPANDRLRGGVGLDRMIPHDEIDRWRALTNPLVAAQRGLAVEQADTLFAGGRPGDAAFPETAHESLNARRGRGSLRFLAVRRLLILLRRLAIEEGNRHLFEPNGDDLRRMIRIDFETMLGELFRRGAFAGTTADDAFRVVTQAADTRTTDNGMAIVELQVAPSTPLEFMTVRLVQNGGSRSVEEVV